MKTISLFDLRRKALKIICCRNLEYETDLTGARLPYSRVTKLTGRNVKSYELDVACSKPGFQTRDNTNGTRVFEKNQNNKGKWKTYDMGNSLYSRSCLHKKNIKRIE